MSRALRCSRVFRARGVRARCRDLQPETPRAPSRSRSDCAERSAETHALERSQGTASSVDASRRSGLQQHPFAPSWVGACGLKIMVMATAMTAAPSLGSGGGPRCPRSGGADGTQQPHLRITIRNDSDTVVHRPSTDRVWRRASVGPSNQLRWSHRRTQSQTDGSGGPSPLTAHRTLSRLW